MAAPSIEGQLSQGERQLIMDALGLAASPPEVCVEVGTWLGGGSTLHILMALEKNGAGHLWGLEADAGIYEKMISNLRAGYPQGLHRFTPLFGFSQKVLPEWLKSHTGPPRVDFAFLDGGDNPAEQILEFRLLDPHLPVGGQLMGHDAKMRKGKWLVPYLQRLDHWECKLYLESPVGLLSARKIRPRPSPLSRLRAESHLLWQRLHPVELAAVLFPQSLRTSLARWAPGLVRWYTARGTAKPKAGSP